PQRGLGVIHVAGSNGKGSVSRMLQSALSASGLRTGLFSSPHLVRFNERYSLGGRAASDLDLEAAARPLWAALKRQAGRPEGPATYFEALTALAFLHFKRVRSDVLVLETGLGGRLDSTNVIARPLLTLITNISLEHTQILGRTESAIAFEKAGIIKKGSPLVTAAQGRARAVILRRFRAVQGASKGKCVVLRRGEDWRVFGYADEPEHGRQRVDLEVLGRRLTVEIPLLGEHQHENLACVLAACSLLEKALSLRWPRILAGLAQASWPGRLQVLSQKPLTLLDGAHNPAGARVLARYVGGLKKRKSFTRAAWVLGVLKDKDWRRMFRTWMPLGESFFVASPPDNRALSAQEAVRWLKLKGCRAHKAESLELALAQAKAWAGKSGLVVATGSLY
ncbi:MAG: bifunctional folylpolyglutamate synthase/dihydrofolate synthase, partial [bacterium]